MRGLSEGDEGVVCGGQCDVEVVGLVLLHPSVAGEVGPSFTRLLGRSRYTFTWLCCVATVHWLQTDVLLVLISSCSLVVHAGWLCMLCRSGLD